jgi:L-fuconolactonase
MNVVDTHVHFWDVDSLSYPWIAKGSAFDRSFLPQDYARATAEIPIERVVFVECDAQASCSLAEAEWVARLAQADPRIQAIVARISLMDAAAVATLDAMAAMPLVRGIRDNIQGHAPGFALQAEFVAGVREVHRHGLHFELCIEHHQLAEAIELVKRCPEGRFVLDHCAKPEIKSGRKEPWAQQMREMAALPNVVCKISGLVTEADWVHWQADEVLGYAGIAAEAFGPERILFGSDWPVNELAGGSLRWFRVAESLASRWSAADQARFFCRNAERIYRLDSSST